MRFIHVSAAAAIVLAGCDPGPGNREPGVDAERSSETGMTAGDTVRAEAGLNGILSRLEIANAAEIRSAELAAERAEASAVKAIANRLETDHARNQSELQSLAGQKDVDLVPASGGRTPPDTAGLVALKGLEGADFDSAFVLGQIRAHEANIEAIEQQLLPATDDAEVRRFLEQTVTAMKQHLDGLEQAREQIGR